MDEAKIERNKNWGEGKVEGMKIRMIIFSFLMFGWREKWEEWKYKGMNFYLFGLIEKWEEWKYYMLNLHLYPYILIFNLQIQLMLF